MVILRLLLLWLGFVLAVAGDELSKTVAQAEYFWGADPGPGLGVPFPAQDGALNEAVESLFKSGVMPPTGAGPHAFHARVRDSNGNWGDVFTTIVHVTGGENNPPRTTKVVMAEYFWDTDPGLGAATPLLAADGSLNETVESLLASGIPAPVSQGAHTFNVRVKDGDGQWGPLFTTVVEVSAPAGTGSVNLAQAEYFWDSDPGPGNGTPLPATDGNLDETLESLLASGIPAPLAAGGHTFNARVKGGDGQWGPLFTTVVEVFVPAVPRPVNVVQAEYFWDSDPGPGNGTPLPAADGNFDETVESLLTSGIPAPLAPGGHTFNARVKGGDGQWGPLFGTVVEVFVPAVPRLVNVVQAEYFWDSDPGPGNGTPLLATDGSLNETLEALIRDPVATPGTFGPHKFHARVKDAAGNWGPVFRTVVNSHIGNGSIYVYDEDDDGDTLPNLVEYFLGTNPKQRDNPADHLSWGLEPVPGGNGKSRLFVEIHRNHVAPDATLDLRVSTNLTDWHGTGDGWVALHSETASTLRFHTAQDLEDKPKFFFRLAVTMDAP